MSEEKQYPSCGAFGEHKKITASNTNEVDSTSDVIYFMTSDGAHKYWEEQQS